MQRKVVCAECKRKYPADELVVIYYGTPKQRNVCVCCYEEKFFVPPAPCGVIKEGQ